ncbi:MAG: hypothetical protein M3619_22090 [Myxococcota bacterium]|nr:hypothetical protein [Myxococcota bacterium]
MLQEMAVCGDASSGRSHEVRATLNIQGGGNVHLPDSSCVYPCEAP